MNYLHRVTPTGAIIIVDDYDYFSTGAKAAVEEFVESKGAAGATYELLVPNTRFGHFAILTKR